MGCLLAPFFGVRACLPPQAIGAVVDGDLSATVKLVWLVAVHVTADRLGLLDSSAAATEATAEATGTAAGAGGSFASAAAAVEARKRAARGHLMGWCRAALEPFQHIALNGLGRPSFGDGRALLALVSVAAPLQCPYAPCAEAPLVGGRSLGSHNFAAAMGAAESLFGAPQLFDPVTETDQVLADCPSEVGPTPPPCPALLPTARRSQLLLRRRPPLVAVVAPPMPRRRRRRRPPLALNPLAVADLPARMTCRPPFL